MKKELKKDGEYQMQRLCHLGEKTGKSPKTDAVNAAQNFGYQIEIRLSMIPVRYPEALWLQRGCEPKTLWKAEDEIRELLDMGDSDILYGVGFEDSMCLYKPKQEIYNDYTGEIYTSSETREDPLTESLPSMRNAKRIAELASDSVNAATQFAQEILDNYPLVKSIYQTGLILYLDTDEMDDRVTEGSAVRKRLVYCRPNDYPEGYLLADGNLYDMPDVWEMAGVEIDPRGNYTDKALATLIEENEPYRECQLVTQFKRFDVKPEGIWTSWLHRLTQETRQ